MLWMLWMLSGCGQPATYEIDWVHTDRYTQARRRGVDCYSGIGCLPPDQIESDDGWKEACETFYADRKAAGGSTGALCCKLNGDTYLGMSGDEAVCARSRW